MFTKSWQLNERHYGALTGLNKVEMTKKIGEDKIASELLLNAIAIVDREGIPYMGWQFYENIYWPEETPSWTSAACILAADANNQLTPGADLFIKQQFKL